MISLAAASTRQRAAAEQFRRQRRRQAHRGRHNQLRTRQGMGGVGALAHQYRQADSSGGHLLTRGGQRRLRRRFQTFGLLILELTVKPGGKPALRQIQHRVGFAVIVIGARHIGHQRQTGRLAIYFASIGAPNRRFSGCPLAAP